ncbi:MAG: LytR family transcriptional regulator, partial [Jatrophihabitans sp.]
MSGAVDPGTAGPSARHRHRAARPPGRWGIWSRRIAGAAALLVSMTLLLGFGYGWYNYRKLTTSLHRVRIEASTPQHAVRDGQAQNILITGNDDRSDMTPTEAAQLRTGTDGGSLATDTMMIVHVPADGTKATLISLPRDAYVDIPGYRKNKLNSAYADGYTASGGTLDQKRAAGANLLVQTVQDLTGLSIDHFVQVNLLGFYRISNAIGGVPVTLCNAVDDSAAANRRAGLDGGSGFVMPAGTHSLQGVTALEFVRQRHFLPNGDLDRAARQRYFLTAAFREIASAGLLLNPGRPGRDPRSAGSAAGARTPGPSHPA